MEDIKKTEFSEEEVETSKVIVEEEFACSDDDDKKKDNALDEKKEEEKDEEEKKPSSENALDDKKEDEEDSKEEDDEDEKKKPASENALDEPEKVETDDSDSTFKLKYEALVKEYAEFKEKFEALNAENATLKEENFALAEFKQNIEKAQKEEMLDQYSMLDEEVIQSYKEKLSEYTLSDLEGALALEYVHSNQSIFTKKEESKVVKVPKTETHQLSGLESILEKYKH